MYSSGSDSAWPALNWGARSMISAPVSTLDGRELGPVAVEEPLQGELGRGRAVLDHPAGPGRGEALVDEAREDVVDPLAGHLGEARDLGRRGGVPSDQREIRLRLVGREAELRESPDPVGDIAFHGRILHTTRRGCDLGDVDATGAGSFPPPAPGVFERSPPVRTLRASCLDDLVRASRPTQRPLDGTDAPMRGARSTCVYASWRPIPTW